MFWKRTSQFLYAKIEYVLIALFVLGFAIAVGSLPYLSSTLSNALAIEEAKRYSRALTEFRSLYTSEVVSRVTGHGIEVSHDYLAREGSIPLPATFSILLGKRLGALEQGGQVRLYSEYPFPWRKGEGAKDAFEREALRQLQQNPTQPYYRFEILNDLPVLRYATADIMREACVSCHNSHPQTPKTGWKVGDLRGVLEIIQPLESATQKVNNILITLIPFIIILGGLGLIGLLVAFKKLRRNSQELESQVADRTESLKHLNQELQEEFVHRKASEEKFKGLFEAACDPLIVVNEQGHIILVNDLLGSLVGYSPQELLGQSMELLVPDRFRDNHSDHRASYTTAPHRRPMGEQNMELWIKRKDGSDCPVEISLSPFRENGAGRVLYTIRNISKQKAAEDALRAAYADTERLLSAISSILIGVDSTGSISRWNGMAEQTFGLPATEALGQNITEASIPWDMSTLKKGIQNCQTTGDTVLLKNVPFRTLSGRDGILSLTLTPVISDGPKEMGCLILGMDLTEHKQLESQLILAQKMESIGQLAAGIAHEINTPTQFVNDNLQFLQRAFDSIQKVLEVYAQVVQALPEGSIDSHLLGRVNTTVAEADLEYATEEIPKALQQSLDGVARVAKIVRAMKDFSHPGTVEKKPIDLNRAIESTVAVARNEWKYVAEVVTDFDPTLPLIPCLPGEFNQVILNLLINAAHAIGDILSNEEGAKGTITISTNLEGEWAEVRIGDTGRGIPESARHKIFDPFFTTKEVGKGTGQGLAIAHDIIVKKHGGNLTFDTEIGTGTTFLIRLPLQVTSAPEKV